MEQENLSPYLFLILKEFIRILIIPYIEIQRVDMTSRKFFIISFIFFITCREPLIVIRKSSTVILLPPRPDGYPGQIARNAEFDFADGRVSVKIRNKERYPWA